MPVSIYFCVMLPDFLVRGDSAMQFNAQSEVFREYFQHYSLIFGRIIYKLESTVGQTQAIISHMYIF